MLYPKYGDNITLKYNEKDGSIFTNDGKYVANVSVPVLPDLIFKNDTPQSYARRNFKKLVSENKFSLSFSPDINNELKEKAFDTIYKHYHPIADKFHTITGAVNNVLELINYDVIPLAEGAKSVINVIDKSLQEVSNDGISGIAKILGINATSFAYNILDVILSPISDIEKAEPAIAKLKQAKYKILEEGGGLLSTKGVVDLGFNLIAYSLPAIAGAILSGGSSIPATIGILTSAITASVNDKTDYISQYKDVMPEDMLNEYANNYALGSFFINVATMRTGRGLALLQSSAMRKVELDGIKKAVPSVLKVVGTDYSINYVSTLANLSAYTWTPAYEEDGYLPIMKQAMIVAGIGTTIGEMGTILPVIKALSNKNNSLIPPSPPTIPPETGLPYTTKALTGAIPLEGDIYTPPPYTPELPPGSILPEEPKPPTSPKSPKPPDIIPLGWDIYTNNPNPPKNSKLMNIALTEEGIHINTPSPDAFINYAHSNITREQSSFDFIKSNNDLLQEYNKFIRSKGFVEDINPKNEKTMFIGIMNSTSIDILPSVFLGKKFDLDMPLHPKFIKGNNVDFDSIVKSDMQEQIDYAFAKLDSNYLSIGSTQEERINALLKNGNINQLKTISILKAKRLPNEFILANYSTISEILSNEGLYSLFTDPIDIHGIQSFSSIIEKQIELTAKNVDTREISAITSIKHKSINEFNANKVSLLDRIIETTDNLIKKYPDDTHIKTIRELAIYGKTGSFDYTHYSGYSRGIYKQLSDIARSSSLEIDNSTNLIASTLSILKHIKSDINNEPLYNSIIGGEIINKVLKKHTGYYTDEVLDVYTTLKSILKKSEQNITDAHNLNIIKDITEKIPSILDFCIIV